jgi:hypothetical protein
MPIEIVREPVSLLHIAELAQGTFGQLVKAVVDTEQQLMAIGDREITLGDLARLTRFTKRNVAVAVRSLALAAVVEVDRAGNEQRVRLARDIGLGQWIGEVRASYVDWVARFTVALRVLQFEVPPSASPRCGQGRRMRWPPAWRG